MAQSGTLFLDEIGELSPDMQSKLLQVMEENSFERVGEARSIGVDIRVLSATNIDLEKALLEGRLRRDPLLPPGLGHPASAAVAATKERHSHSG